MNRRIIPFFIFLLFSAVFGGGALSAATSDASSLTSGNYVLDKNHASLLFRINHLGFSMYHGRFNSFDAKLSFDSREPEKSVVEATIDVGSVDTNHEKLESELKGDKFFNTAKFPTASFRSVKTTRSGNSGTMIGELTLMGVTKPVTLNVTFRGGGPHPMSKKPLLGFAARGVFNRSQWGINYGIPNVGDEVAIEIEAEFEKPDKADKTEAAAKEKTSIPSAAQQPAAAAPAKDKEKANTAETPGDSEGLDGYKP